MVTRDGLGGVGRDHGVSVSRRGVGRGIGRHAEHRQQEAGVVEPGGCAVVGCAVDVDQQRVDAGLVDVPATAFGRDRSG